MPYSRQVIEFAEFARPPDCVSPRLRVIDHPPVPPMKPEPVNPIRVLRALLMVSGGLPPPGSNGARGLEMVEHWWSTWHGLRCANDRE